MEDQSINKEKLIEFWIQSSNDDFDTMNAMFKTKRYNRTLFIGHLMIEKLLKAYYVKVNSDYPPFIHNLLRLAEKSNMELTPSKKEELATITAFNINARYDDYKMSFKMQCTPQFTSEWLHKLTKTRLWILALIEK